MFYLADLCGRKNAVIFFYPRANTAICTREACAFRDHFEEFVSARTEVIGISDDAPAEQARFADRFHLPFPLLSDTRHQARDAFGVGKWMGLLKNRITFVVDTDGYVRAVINARFFAEHHVREALKTLAANDQRSS